MLNCGSELLVGWCLDKEMIGGTTGVILFRRIHEGCTWDMFGRTTEAILGWNAEVIPSSMSTGTSWGTSGWIDWEILGKVPNRFSEPKHGRIFGAISGENGDDFLKESLQK